MLFFLHLGCPPLRSFLPLPLPHTTLQVKALYQKHCDSMPGSGSTDTDVEKEAARQREYLEKTVDSLKRKLAKDSDLHRSDNLRIMQVWLRRWLVVGLGDDRVSEYMNESSE